MSFDSLSPFGGSRHHIERCGKPDKYFPKKMQTHVESLFKGTSSSSREKVAFTASPLRKGQEKRSRTISNRATSLLRTLPIQ